MASFYESFVITFEESPGVFVPRPGAEVFIRVAGESSDLVEAPLSAGLDGVIAGGEMDVDPGTKFYFRVPNADGLPRYSLSNGVTGSITRHWPIRSNLTN